MKKFNYRLISGILGILLAMNGLFMLLCLPFSIYYQEGDTMALLIAGSLTLAVGGGAYWFSRTAQTTELKRKDGYIIVTFGWVLMSFFGSLPYILSGAIPPLTDAFFETISGFSTTGATILTDIEGVHKGILFWRSLTQWIGGMGIIVLTVAILPILGIGGMQLFVAEAPGITPDKLQPRIKETAKRLWLLYVVLTLIECVLLMFGGMSFYDALNHSLTTMASGGFSTKNDSIAHYPSAYIQYVIILFMVISGTSFTINYLIAKGLLKKVFKNEEFQAYIIFVGVCTIIVAAVIYRHTPSGLEYSIRTAMFHVVAIVTTTGYATADYTSWAPLATVIFFMLLFFGSMAGSTSGGVKIVRHLILLKNSVLELKRQIHPSAIIPVRFNGKAISQEINFNVLAFIMIYFSIFALGSLVVSTTGVDFVTSISAVAACLGNVGPGIGNVGPVDNFAHLPSTAKWLLAFLMLVGRLELFTVLILFTPYFWKS